MAASSEGVREKNKEARRQRILSEARRVLATQGYGALNTRDLALAAGVTPPTLYNLIGSKDEIVAYLNLEAVTLIESRLQPWRKSAPLQMAEAIVIESVETFGGDEHYFRAAFIAGESAIDDGAGSLGQTLKTRSVNVAADAVTAARKQKLLKGKVPVDAIAEQMYACYRAPLRDWVADQLTLTEFMRQALTGFYLVLAADAVDTFRETLMNRLKSVSQESLSDIKNRSEVNEK